MIEKTGRKIIEEHLTKSGLKDRGWTESLINKFLGEPDLTKDNPMYRRAAPMCLYALKRIEQAELLPEFREAQAKMGKRREAAKKANNTKIAKLMKYVEEIKIEVPILPRKKLVSLACRSYNDIQMERAMCGRSYSEKIATKSSDEKFLNRIIVNYLRHELTEYESHLENIFGKVGVFEAYVDIKAKILETIGITYSWLKEECEIQAGLRERNNIETKPITSIDICQTDGVENKNETTNAICSDSKNS